MNRKLPKGTMIRCVICGGEREAYKDCPSCAEKRAAGLIPPEMTAEQRKAARRANMTNLATNDAFPAATRRHVANYLYDEAAKLAPLRSGRKGGAANKDSPRVEALFDKLLKANPDLPAEEVRTLKGTKATKGMGASTFARHWKAAKDRAKK